MFLSESHDSSDKVMAGLSKNGIQRYIGLNFLIFLILSIIYDQLLVKMLEQVIYEYRTDSRC
jgi:hypothetical protein